MNPPKQPVPEETPDSGNVPLELRARVAIAAGSTAEEVLQAARGNRQLSIRVKKELHDALAAESERTGASMNELLTRKIEAAEAQPKYAQNACTAFEEIIHSRTVMRSVNNALRERLAQELGASERAIESLFMLLREDIKLVDVAPWARSGAVEIKLVFSIPKTWIYGDHKHEYDVSIEGTGEIYFQVCSDRKQSDDEPSFELTTDTMRVVAKVRPKKPKDPDGFIDDDLPF